MFGPDGTQAPPPPRAYPDPLAGLVAAESYLARPLSRPVAPPAPPEPSEEARRAIAAQMAREQQARRPQQLRQRPPAHIPRPPADVPAQQAQQAVAKTSDTTNALLGCGCVLMIVVAVVVIVVALFG